MHETAASLSPLKIYNMISRYKKRYTLNLLKMVLLWANSVSVAKYSVKIKHPKFQWSDNYIITYMNISSYCFICFIDSLSLKIAGLGWGKNYFQLTMPHFTLHICDLKFKFLGL